MTEVVCSAVMLLLSLCSPAAQPARPGPGLQVVRVAPSTDLLGRQIAVAPATSRAAPWGDPGRLAFCGPDGVRRSLDGGQTWTVIPTDGVAALAAGTALPLAPPLDSAPACQSVLLDPAEPDTFYAVFRAVRAPQDAPPPSFATGYVTQDAGQSWQPVPLPPDPTDLLFAGFTAETGIVQALYDRTTATSRPPGRPNATAETTVTTPVVMATNDGGRTWQPVPFNCPASGACIRWGAPPTGIGSCAMHGYGQPLLASADGGQTWQAPTGAPVANGCRPNELVTIADRDVLLLAPGGSEIEPDAAPVRISHDGGRTFAAHTLPAGPAADDLFELYLLPGERLLARVSGPSPGPGWSWQILWHDNAPPAQDRWCPAAPSPLPTTGAPLRLAGDHLWWVSGSGEAASLALADLRCDAPNDGPPSTPVP